MSFRRLIVVALVALAVLWSLWLAQLISLSFERLGLSPLAAALVLVGSLVVGWVNIPVWRQRVRAPAVLVPFTGWLFYEPPRAVEKILAINLGGTLIPLAVDGYLLARALERSL